MRYEYDQGYREERTLSSGLNVVFRTVHPDDKQHFSAGMARLSPTSRHSRFLSVKNGLSERDLKHLTEIDGENHFAIGAALVSRNGAEYGIGVARFVRLNDEPEVAEPAITVIDEYQGQGVGTALLRRLVEAARERGIHRFRFDFLGDNTKVRALFDEFEEHAVTHHDRGVITMELSLPPSRPDEHPRVTLKRSVLYRVLVRAAQGLLSLQHNHNSREPPRSL